MEKVSVIDRLEKVAENGKTEAILLYGKQLQKNLNKKGFF